MALTKEKSLLTYALICFTTFYFFIQGMGISNVNAEIVLDPPHGPPIIDCDSCHPVDDQTNADLCITCHAGMSSSTWADWQPSDQASPGTSGTSHRWDADVFSWEYGAEFPLSTEMNTRLNGTNLMCSTCHDQHESNQTGGTITVTPVDKTADGGGTGTVSVEPPGQDAKARYYDIEIVEGSPSAKFRVSNDKGISWFGWDGSGWAPGHAAGRPVGSNVFVNDGTNIAVSFTGSFEVGDEFSFGVWLPFLRIDNTASAMCNDCHRNWVQSSLEQQSGGDGVKVFSHPVGESLSKPYDRTVPLDANGAPQSTGDGNSSNDLSLSSSGQVHCMTCHQPHGADSNSLTED
jgi:hypothetical protein